MKIKYSKKSLKFLAKMEKSIVDQIRTAVIGLTKEPPEGDIKVMQGYNDGTMRLRVGKYRVIYIYESYNNIKVLFIKDIGSRGDIYK